MQPKDNFSKQAHLYAKFRPRYPQALYDFILAQLKGRQKAWDCATGNGQVASHLAQYFDQVVATDISQKQLENATLAPNIEYLISPAEHTPFEQNTFDLVTVGQAIHWFEFTQFYQEVQRVCKPNALLAVWGYGTLLIDNKELNDKFQHFYQEQIGDYWDGERRYIDEEYQTIPFTFEEIKTPSFSMNYHWDFDQLEGYLNTWSSVQKYINQHQTNPVTQFIEACKDIFTKNAQFEVFFPVFLKIGRVAK